MAAIEPVQVATGRTGQNHPIDLRYPQVVEVPQLQSSTGAANLTEGQDFPSGNAGLEN